VRFDINGKEVSVVFSPSRNRNAWARLRGDILTVTVPSRWPESEKRRVGSELLRKAIIAIEKGKWTGEQAGKIRFANGQKLAALGRRFEIEFISARSFRGKFTESGGRLVIAIDSSHPKKTEKANALAREKIIESFNPELEARVRRINEEHFRASLGRISVRDNLSRWGSCSRDGSISLNLRLLFMPDEILDYVIVHELAHTRYRSHGPRFWALVESVLPDHRERRKWLRENGWDYPKDDGTREGELGQELSLAKKEGQLTIADFSHEEPY
jgi:predicted metal-dependent hydrolase